MKLQFVFMLIAPALWAVSASDSWVAAMREATLLDQQGHYQQAHTIFDRLAGEAVALNLDEALRAEFDSAAGVNCFHLALYPDARRFFLEATGVWRQSDALPARQNLALSLGNLAALDRAEAHFSAAESLYREEFEILEHIGGNGSSQYAIALNNLAELRRSEGDLESAGSLAREAAKLAEKAFPPDDENSVVALNTLATVLSAEGKLDEAEPALRRVLDVWRKALGPDHPKVASVEGNLADVLLKRHDYEQAESLSRHSLEIRRKTLGPEHPLVALNFNNLGCILRQRRNYAEAESAFQEAVRIARRSDFLTNLGILEAERGRFTAAQTLLEEAARIDAANFGTTDVRTLLAQLTLARTYQANRQLTAAERIYRDALPLLENSRAATDARVLQARADYQKLLGRKPTQPRA